MDKRIDVVGAVIVRRGLVLCAQRGASGTLAGMWEFPGGKVEAGEAPREALQREIAEELQCAVAISAEVARATYEYDFGVVALTTFLCDLTAGQPQLTEHAAIQWLAPSRLGELNWAPADLPTVNALTHDISLVLGRSSNA